MRIQKTFHLLKKIRASSFPWGLEKIEKLIGPSEHNRMYLKSILFYLALAILIIILIPFGHDSYFHLQRINAIAQEFSHNGIFSLPVRMYTSTLQQYGYASPLFYPDLLLYLPAFFVYIGIKTILAYKMMLVTILFFSAFSMYFFLDRMSKNKEMALLGAILYISNPYFLTDLLNRGAVGESFAFVFLPMAFYGWYSIVVSEQQNSRDWLFLAFGMSGLILSHLISAVLCAIILLIYGIINIKSFYKSSGRILNLCFAVISTIGLTAFFVFPMFEQLLATKFYVTTVRISDFVTSSRTIPYHGLFTSWELLNSIKMLLKLDITFISYKWYPGWIGIAFAVCLFLRVKYRKQLDSRFYNHMLIAAFASLLFCLPIFPHEPLDKMLKFIQFPWRILLFFAFFSSLFLAYTLRRIDQKKVTSVTLVILLSIATINIILIFAPSVKNVIVQQKMPNYYTDTTMVGGAEYLPAEVPSKNYILDRGEVIKSNYSTRWTAFTRKNGVLRFIFLDNTHQDTYYELPLLMYKGYQAYDLKTGKNIPFRMSQNGLVQIATNAPEGDILVWYEGTLVQKRSSLITLATMILLLIVHRRRRVTKLQESNEFFESIEQIRPTE
jgi:hypothetical protein